MHQRVVARARLGSIQHLKRHSSTFKFYILCRSAVCIDMTFTILVVLRISLTSAKDKIKRVLPLHASPCSNWSSSWQYLLPDTSFEHFRVLSDAAQLHLDITCTVLVALRPSLISTDDDSSGWCPWLHHRVAVRAREGSIQHLKRHSSTFEFFPMPHCCVWT